jgi:hypothetical protein
MPRIVDITGALLSRGPGDHGMDQIAPDIARKAQAAIREK